MKKVVTEIRYELVSAASNVFDSIRYKNQRKVAEELQKRGWRCQQYGMHDDFKIINKSSMEGRYKGDICGGEVIIWIRDSKLERFLANYKL